MEKKLLIIVLLFFCIKNLSAQEINGLPKVIDGGQFKDK